MGTLAKLVRLVGQVGGSEKQQTTLMNAELLSNVAGPVHGIIWSLKCRWHNKVMGNALMDAEFSNFLNPTIQSQVVSWDCPLGLHTLCKTSSMCTGQCCMLDWRCEETQQHIYTHLIGARLVWALIRQNLEPKMEDLSHKWQTIANLSQNGHRHFYLLKNGLHFVASLGPKDTLTKNRFVSFNKTLNLNHIAGLSPWFALFLIIATLTRSHCL